MYLTTYNKNVYKTSVCYCIHQDGEKKEESMETEDEEHKT